MILGGILLLFNLKEIIQKVTINGKISVLKSFFGTLYREEVILKDPTLRIKNIKVDVKIFKGIFNYRGIRNCKKCM